MGKQKSVKSIKEASIKEAKRPAGEVIADACHWLDTIESKLTGPGIRAEVNHVLQLLRPLCPKPETQKVSSLETLTDLLAGGLRRFRPGEETSAKRAAADNCVICRRPFQFARLCFWYSPAKHERGYAHVACYEKRFDEFWNKGRRESTFNETSATVCQCGHGYGAHRADDSHGGTDYMECEANFRVPKWTAENGKPIESTTAINCACDHFRPGGELKDDETRVKEWIAEHPEIAAANAVSVAEVTGEMTAADRAELVRINYDMAEADDIEAFGREALE